MNKTFQDGMLIGFGLMFCISLFFIIAVKLTQDRLSKEAANEVCKIVTNNSNAEVSLKDDGLKLTCLIPAEDEWKPNQNIIVKVKR